MASCTDRLKLNDHDLFKSLKNDLPKSAKETHNIIEIRDNVMYIWNPDKCCLYAVIIDDDFTHSSTYQVFQLTDPPIFEVTSISINEASTQLALWGSLGIIVLELPRRWGKNNLFQGGKKSISCLNHNLSHMTSQLSSSKVNRVRWHPGSPNDSHLLVLTSDNSFQLFECSLGHKPKLVKNWKVGPTPLSSSSKGIPLIESLGETAIDFDFSTSSISNRRNNKEITHWSDIEWPILVLRGDGSVLLIQGDTLSNTGKKPMVQGSLSIYPASFDNYGDDSCSITCLQTTPPVVAIATSTGLIHHAILLRDTITSANDNFSSTYIIDSQSSILYDDQEQRQFERTDKKSWSVYGSNYSLHTPDDGLFVFETIEMQLGLLFNDNDKKYNCLINLHRDRGNKGRYFCTHNAGVHMITLPAVSQLMDYLNCSEENIDLYLPTSFKPSTSQYLICTRTKHTEDNEPTPVLGFGLLQQPSPIVIALLYNGVVVNFSVIDFDCPSAIDCDEPTVPSNDSEAVATRKSFKNHVKNLLKHESTSQPITKLSAGSSLNGKECFELLDQATNVLRSNYFVKHDRVRNEISKKVRTLKALKVHQMNELNDLMQVKAELHSKAQSLAERYEDIKEHQEELTRRSRDVLKRIKHKELTTAERAEALKLKEMNNKLEEFKGKFDKLKNKVDNQLMKNESTDKNILNNPSKKAHLILGEKQEKVIKTNLQKMGCSIKEIIGQVKLLEDELEV